MTDINASSSSEPNPKSKLLAEVSGLSEDQDRILSTMELLYFAYRDFTGESDEVLEKIGFGRAHHRVIHFVHHYPGRRVADLLNILKITKQSLARVLKQLIDRDYIRQEPGPNDRRERHLYTSSKGDALAKSLAQPQIDRLFNAINSLDEKEVETVEKFLFSLIEKGHRHEVITLMAENGHKIGQINHLATHKTGK